MLLFLNEHRKVPGIGRINERLVQSLGIETCGDILNHKVELYLLRKELQSDGLLRANLGIFSNIVAPAKKYDLSCKVIPLIYLQRRQKKRRN